MVVDESSDLVGSGGDIAIVKSWMQLLSITTCLGQLGIAHTQLDMCTITLGIAASAMKPAHQHSIALYIVSLMHSAHCMPHSANWGTQDRVDSESTWDANIIMYVCDVMTDLIN